MYDFCDNAHVQRQAILKSHQTATRQRVQAHRLILTGGDRGVAGLSGTESSGFSVEDF